MIIPGESQELFDAAVADGRIKLRLIHGFRVCEVVKDRLLFIDPATCVNVEKFINNKNCAWSNSLWSPLEKVSMT
jgi:hypothetical protein